MDRQVVRVEPPGDSPRGAWRDVIYQELCPFDGGAQVVRVFVPWVGFARAQFVGGPYTAECLPREEFAVN